MLMASTTGFDQNGTNDGSTSSSYFQKTVCLHDWWLIKAEKDFEGKRLAVAGFTSREKQAVRVFSSAPIVRRYDIFTLETADGICVVIKGFINKLRTIDNGFPSEVFGHFVVGFPYYWEEYSAILLEGDSTTSIHAEGNSVRGTKKEETEAVNGSNSKRNKRHHVPSVSDDVSNIVNDNCECEGTDVSSPSADRGQEPMHDNAVRKVHVEHTEDGSLLNYDSKHVQTPGNIMTQSGVQTRSNNFARSPIGCENNAEEERTVLTQSECENSKNALLEGKNNAEEENMCRKKPCIFSPESLNFGRSRSGRLLMPVLEFWRNQVPVYDADRTITGIKDDLPLTGSSGGSMSEPQKKRRQ